MTMGVSLLDEIEFTRAPMLSSVDASVNLATSPVRSLPVSGSQRTIKLRSPYFVRDLSAMESGAAWASLCHALRKYDIPIFSSAQSLDGVPAASVPARWSGRVVDEPFESIELTTADLFEVSCLSRDRRGWCWPGEIATEHIDGLLRSVRSAAGGDTPVGLGIPLGCHPDDLRRCLQADIDFISLSCTYGAAHWAHPAIATQAGGTQADAPAVSGPTVGALTNGLLASAAAARASQAGGLSAGDVSSIVRCRQMLRQLDRPQLPLLVTAPVVDAEQAHKLLALGASAVSIDHIVRQSLALDVRPLHKEESVAEMRHRLPSLSLSVASTAKKLELPQLETQLKLARRTLFERLQSVGASSLSEFDERCLVSLSQRAQQATSVKRLEL